MTEKHTSNNPAELSPTEASAAQPVKGMPWVLGISTAVVIVLLIAVLIIFM